MVHIPGSTMNNLKQMSSMLGLARAARMVTILVGSHPNFTG